MRRIVRVSTRTRNGVFAGSFAAPPPAMARNAARTISRSATRVPFIRDLYAATAAKVPQPRLFDRDGLREVPRLVDVEPAEAGDPVGEELERDDRERRLQQRVRPRH